jgi:hypothetical protein
MTQASLSKRRGQGEDSIYWDASKNRYVGAVSLGFNPAGTRIRKKVAGRTKTEVRDKLKELHKQVESGLRPRRRYTGHLGPHGRDQRGFVAGHHGARTWAAAWDPSEDGGP